MEDGEKKSLKFKCKSLMFFLLKNPVESRDFLFRITAVIKTEEKANCFLCGKEGETLYAGLEDMLYGTPGKYGFKICRECGVIWESPRPLKEEIWKAYETYFTHTPSVSYEGSKKRFERVKNRLRNILLSELWGYDQFKVHKWWAPVLARILYCIPFVRERARFRMGELIMPFIKNGRLLEIGCGSGWYLDLMRKMGWDVQGVEVDKKACEVAKEKYGINVIEGNIEDIELEKERFDAIVMNHVIEHLYNPVGVLQKCYGALRGGKLVVTTPNVFSLGHKIYKEMWVGLDPPRHIHLFSPKSLKEIFEKVGFKVLKLYTRPVIFLCCKRERVDNVSERKEDFTKKVVWMCRVEGILIKIWNWIGEEIMVVGEKEQ